MFQQDGDDGLAVVDLEIRDARIASVVPASASGDGAPLRASPDAPDIDLRRGQVWPCFVDVHTHLDKGHTWERAQNPDGTFDGALRAVMQDRETASLMGVNVYRTIGNTFGASAALGAAAGVLVAPLIHIQFNMGFILVKAFAAACLGGIFSIPGAIAGGLIIGVVEGLVAAYASAAYRDAIVYALLIGALLFRPEGLFGRR